MVVDARVFGLPAAGPALLAAAMVTPGCSPDSLDTPRVESVLSEAIGARFGVEIAEVTCPERIEMREGEDFECTVRTPSGLEARFAVTQVDGEGNIEWETVTPDGFLDMFGVGVALSTGIRDQLGLEPAEVRCPEQVEMRAGNSFDCAMRTQGGAEITVTVDQADDEGNIEWETTASEGILNLEALAEQIRTGIQRQTGVETTVDCGGRFGDTPPGGTLDCTATDAQGETATVTVTVQDREGNVDWSIGEAGEAGP